VVQASWQPPRACDSRACWLLQRPHAPFCAVLQLCAAAAARAYHHHPCRRVREMREKMTSSVLEDADVICATCVGSGGSMCARHVPIPAVLARGVCVCVCIYFLCEFLCMCGMRVTPGLKSRAPRASTTRPQAHQHISTAHHEHARHGFKLISTSAQHTTSTHGTAASRMSSHARTHTHTHTHTHTQAATSCRASPSLWWCWMRGRSVRSPSPSSPLPRRVRCYHWVLTLFKGS